jgi:hypothetical protein
MLQVAVRWQGEFVCGGEEKEGCVRKGEEATGKERQGVRKGEEMAIKERQGVRKGKRWPERGRVGRKGGEGARKVES